MTRSWERVGAADLVGSQASFDSMSGALTSDIVDKIGKQFRDIYDAVVHEPLPDQFCQLLSGLEHS